MELFIYLAGSGTDPWYCRIHPRPIAIRANVQSCSMTTCNASRLALALWEKAYEPGGPEGWLLWDIPQLARHVDSSTGGTGGTARQVWILDNYKPFRDPGTRHSAMCLNSNMTSMLENGYDVS